MGNAFCCSNPDDLSNPGTTDKSAADCDNSKACTGDAAKKEDGSAPDKTTTTTDNAGKEVDKTKDAK